MPPHQVIDTVDLYFLKNRQRRLSLRFLTWFVLDEHIQQDTHDSIEDARCALKLYNAFQSFEEQGVFDQKLDELYKEGRQYVRSHYHVTKSFVAHLDHDDRTSSLQRYRINLPLQCLNIHSRLHHHNHSTSATLDLSLTHSSLRSTLLLTR